MPGPAAVRWLMLFMPRFHGGGKREWAAPGKNVLPSPNGLIGPIPNACLSAATASPACVRFFQRLENSGVSACFPLSGNPAGGMTAPRHPIRIPPDFQCPRSGFHGFPCWHPSRSPSAGTRQDAASPNCEPTAASPPLPPSSTSPVDVKGMGTGIAAGLWLL